MTDPYNPAPPEEIPAAEPTEPPPGLSPEAAVFTVTFTGPPARNSMRLDGEGTLTFDEDDTIVEAEQIPQSAPRRRVRFMFALAEITRVGLHEGALVLVVTPRSDPSLTHTLSFYVASEGDARRIMALLHAPMAAAEPPPIPHDASIDNFYARLRRASATATQALLAANLAVFGLMALTGMNLLDPDSQSLIRWGARVNELIAQGQWWRVATPMFVHVGLLHLAFNMWALKNLGDFVERLYGFWRFLLIYFAAGLIGDVASMLYRPDSMAAGASGAIFGIMGALAAFIFRRRQVIPRPILGNIRNTVFSLIGYNLVFTWIVPQIDGSAHVGGLIGGFVLGWLLAPAEKEADETRRPPSRARQRVYASLLAAVLTGLMVLGYQMTTPERSERALLASDAVDAVSDVVKKAYGDQAPECEAVEVDQQVGPHRYQGAARLRDGRTVAVVLVVQKDGIEAILPRQ
jgi:membrane associated rhomboid family serine protease